ncbi:hypothetical protein EZV62_008367 [Acer yangbiense]|uniref:Disease resistance RPP13-like protein 4 n=1 Tax=Acer yangbiense TaxID=1000413 RepID=A0A5C7IDW6_9ROSI|nr:hypothetical protein EZV62_008367 [Acer yangbiense]
MASTNPSEKSNPSHKSEIEEIVETDLPTNNPHYNENTQKKDDDDGDGDGDIDGDGDGDGNGNSNSDNNSDVSRGENKKKDGRKATLTRFLCNPLRPARFWITAKNERSSSKREDDKEDNYYSHMNNTPPESDFDAHLPNFLSQYQFKQSSFFKEFVASFQKLVDRDKKCLASFILFPENTVVKKRMLVYWWIGEGLLDFSKTQGKAVEDIASDILDDFMVKRFILSVNKKRKMVGNKFKMHPHVRSAMIVLALEGKTSFDSRSDGNKFSWFHDRGYLINSGPLETENPENKITLFNVSHGFLDFSIEWFSKMRKAKVLYLGMWQSSAEKQHIEVVGTDFLKGLKYMKNLRFLSFQGISGIQELPSSISYLKNLRILDLRACYNLEKLPKEIDTLKNLTHLDISECYLLDCMPKELLWLSELQVFKGFVITDAKISNRCTLAELAGLKKLRKLSVNVNSETFSIEEFSVIFKFKQLLNLKIIWGVKCSKGKRNKKSKQENGEAKAKSKVTKLESMISSSIKRQLSTVSGKVRRMELKKLELHCLPHKTLPNWLNPEKLTNLKKLYIKGGGLKSLGRIQESNNWPKVKNLRLKYLSELKLNWRDLRALFPQLEYLEKFKCPKVTFCPCDCTGIWVKSSTKDSAPPPQITTP